MEAKNNTAIIVGAVSGVLGFLLILVVVLCFLRRCRCKYLARWHTRPVNDINEFPHPFLLRLQEPVVVPEAKGQHKCRRLHEEHEDHKPVSENPGMVDEQDTSDERDSRNPFRDPEAISGDVQVQGMGSTLDHPQLSTNQPEPELLQQSNLAYPGELSDDNRIQLDEGKHTTGLTVSFNQTYGHLSTVSGGTNYSTPPPSYHSD